MEKQKSIIVLHQKKEKANGESADGLMNMGDIRKGSVCQNVTKLETGESIVAKGGKVRRERSIEKGEEAEKNIHPVTGHFLHRRCCNQNLTITWRRNYWKSCGRQV